MNSFLTVGQSQHGAFRLAVDAVTSTFAILAKKGKGKSYTASVIAEEMLKADQQIVVIDPTGAWWGMQSSADGSAEGFPVVVLGGDHGNMPLEESAAEVIAHAIVEKRFSAIIDLSHLRKNAANWFVGLFLETLYRINREPLHLFVDEADAFAPQRPGGEDARTLGAMEDIVRRGRIRGIGCTMITQRPQIINKNVLTQVDTLIAGQVSHPKDIDAIKEWIDVHADSAQSKLMVDSLPSLPTGTMWFWSPGWGEFFERVAVRSRETFNSGATPKPGETVRKPKKLAPIDIEALGAAINESVSRKLADDPKLLRKRVAELERIVNSKSNAGTVDSQLVEREVAKAVAERDKFWKTEQSKLQSAFESVKGILVKIQQLADKAGETISPAITVPTPPAIRAVPPTVTAPRLSSGRTDASLPKAERKILTVLAQRRPRPTEKKQLAVLAEYRHNGGGYKNALGALRSMGYIVGSDIIEATDEGIAALGQYEPLPNGFDLVRYWQTKFPKAERAILEALVASYPNRIDKVKLALECGYEASGGGYKNALGKLRTYELIEGSQEIKLKDTIFE